MLCSSCYNYVKDKDPGWSHKQGVVRMVEDAKRTLGDEPTLAQRALVAALELLAMESAVSRAVLVRAVPDVNVRAVKEVFEQLDQLDGVICVSVRRGARRATAYVMAASAPTAAAQRAQLDLDDEVRAAPS